MNFGSQPIPKKLFDLARERLNQACSTPEQVRAYVIERGQPELLETSSIVQNHRIIADRVFQAVRLEMVEAGTLEQLKRGLWATTKFLRSAEASEAALSDKKKAA